MKQHNYYSATDDISFTPLSPEYERELFERYYNGGDLNARDEIIHAHLKLVAKLSLRQSKGVLFENEAISAGNFGLMQAMEAKLFKPDRGVRFGSYLRLYIRGQVLLAIKEKIERNRESGHGQKEPYAFDATVTGTMRQTLPESDSNFRGMKVATSDTLWTYEKPTTDVVDGESDVDAADRASIVADAISQLTEVEQAAILGTYFEQISFAEIGRRLDEPLTREGVRKAHDRAMGKLRDSLGFLESEFKVNLAPVLTPDFNEEPETIEEAA